MKRCIATVCQQSQTGSATAAEANASRDLAPRSRSGHGQGLEVVDPLSCEKGLDVSVDDKDGAIGNEKRNTPKAAEATKKQRKEFDMRRFRQRQVAIQLQYEGGAYFGFASQSGDCEDTIEKHLFEALVKLKLVESRQTCNYSRCGRTDKGVSASGRRMNLPRDRG